MSTETEAIADLHTKAVAEFLASEAPQWVQKMVAESDLIVSSRPWSTDAVVGGVVYEPLSVEDTERTLAEVLRFASPDKEPDDVAHFVTNTLGLRLFGERRGG